VKLLPGEFKPPPHQHVFSKCSPPMSSLCALLRSQSVLYVRVCVCVRTHTKTRLALLGANVLPGEFDGASSCSHQRGTPPRYWQRRNYEWRLRVWRGCCVCLRPTKRAADISRTRSLAPRVVVRVVCNSRRRVFCKVAELLISVGEYRLSASGWT
jgi:hypothetical protein